MATNVAVYILCIAFLLNMRRSYTEDGCEPGSYKFNSFCYSYVETLQPFHDAEKTCLSQGGHLVIIQDRRTAKFIEELYKRVIRFNAYWIGISDRDSEGNWKYVSNNHSLEYTNWRKREPNNALQDQHCGMVREDYAFTWDDNKCEKKAYYICQHKDTSPFCRHKAKFNGNCYEVSQHAKSFESSLEACHKSGGMLAEIKTMHEQRSVEDAIKAQIINSAWIGVYRSHGIWMYVDDNLVTEFYWKHGHPAEGANKDCVSYTNKTWINNNCQKLFPSFCQTNDTAISVLLPPEPERYNPLTLIVSITCAASIILILILAYMYYRKRMKERVKDQPPPVPRRVNSLSFQSSRDLSFYSASDGYVITDEPPYLQPRTSNVHTYQEMGNVENIYESIPDQNLYRK